MYFYQQGPVFEAFYSVFAPFLKKKIKQRVGTVLKEY